METNQKSGTDTAISVVSAIFGVAHFMFQSAADLTAHAEGSVVNKISKGAISKEEAITNRRNVTDLRQSQTLLKLREMQSKVKEQQQLKQA